MTAARPCPSRGPKRTARITGLRLGDRLTYRAYRRQPVYRIRGAVPDADREGPQADPAAAAVLRARAGLSHSRAVLRYLNADVRFGPVITAFAPDDKRP